MNNNRLFFILQKNTLSYKDKLCKFFNKYDEYLKYLYAYISNPECSEKEKYIIKKLENWMYDEGYELLTNTIQRLDTSAESKVIKFMELYEFLLSCSANSIEKMVDQLFYIPGQFSSQFMLKETSLVGTIEEDESNSCTNSATSYIVIKKGIFCEIPFLINGGYLNEY